MRLGFILGFLVGGGIASLLARPHEEPAAVLEDAATTAQAEGHAVADRIKNQVDEAKDAAREAQLEKEAELLQLYDDLIHRKEPPPPTG
jgi:hypothetical protein